MKVKQKLDRACNNKLTERKHAFRGKNGEEDFEIWPESLAFSNLKLN